MKLMVEKKVTPVIQSAQSQLSEIRTLIEENRAFKNQENIVSFEAFKEKFSFYEFPLQAMNDYNQFNDDLKFNKKDIKTKLVNIQF